MKSMLIQVDDHGIIYQALKFVCPGCATSPSGATGLHILPVNTEETSPSWDFDGNLDAPTITPSILTRTGRDNAFVCHSFLKNGIFEFLNDCTHELVGKKVPIPDLPDWVVNE